MAELTYLQAISDGLRTEMRRDKRVFLIGEDVGVYGGAFKVTLGFQEEFGPWRVIDAPLAESAIIGACTGASIMGMRPVAEMQFADFISCGWDQLVTVAAKQRWRAGTPVPITVRLPSGGGFSGGPFHSQNPESSFAHIPGLKCVCPATPADAKGLLVSAIEDPNPVLFFEHKHLYRRIKGEVPDERYTTPIGEARLHREGDDLTVITWGAMVYTAAEAASKLDDVSVEIVDLRSVMPWDKEAVLTSVRKTSKVLVLHEDTRTGGFGAEIAATIAEADEPLLEISTDKVDTEVPSPGAGVLSEILVQEGETVEVGTLLARIGGEPGTAAPPPPKEEAPPEPATQPAADEASAAADEGVREAPPEPASPPARTPAGNSHDGDGHAFVSPVVARIAAEHGIDPSTVQGTGSGGRVTKKDILAFVESKATTPAPPEQPQPAPAENAPAPAPPPAAPTSQTPQAFGEGEQ